MFWVWIWKISPKNVKIFNFFPFGSKKSLRVGSKSTQVKDGLVRAHLNSSLKSHFGDLRLTLTWPHPSILVIALAWPNFLPHIVLKLYHFCILEKFFLKQIWPEQFLIQIKLTRITFFQPGLKRKSLGLRKLVGWRSFMLEGKQGQRASWKSLTNKQLGYQEGFFNKTILFCLSIKASTI